DGGCVAPAGHQSGQGRSRTGDRRAAVRHVAGRRKPGRRHRGRCRMNARMPLRDLLAGVVEPAAAGDIVVSGLSLDSRRVRPGDAFVALEGGTTHGIEFAPMALERGAVVVLDEYAGPGSREARTATSSSGALDVYPDFLGYD